MMLRRLFLQAAIVTALLAPLAAPSAAQADSDTAPYSPETVKSALADGRAVLLEFAAPW
ncbi:MAG: hypothetical protein HOA08_05215 [Rhodospirillaceae bacterium]|jgi:hypothetical protein|nr:hypothetical protein [Rhodospirillaceae bacterium]MBT3492264.1 hypothetical protein [Rhodospirillaceae bacterium]MBT3782305.1 hypothetical protein [Rhodospirillaceae bacterium]MBT3975119.1 hypothetical protein [Rhodospirillaceae bacterium]MBT4166757.1 hypothetical protein [Rhodospirillaceae bacterium]